MGGLLTRVSFARNYQQDELSVRLAVSWDGELLAVM